MIGIFRKGEEVCEVEISRVCDIAVDVLGDEWKLERVGYGR